MDVEWISKAGRQSKRFPELSPFVKTSMASVDVTEAG